MRGIILALCVGLYSVAYAEPKADLTKAAKMEPLEAAQLDAAMARMREGQLAAKEAAKKVLEQLEIAKYEKQARAILSKYGIPPEALGKDVFVDFETGTITRPKPKAKGK